MVLYQLKQPTTLESMAVNKLCHWINSQVLTLKLSTSQSQCNATIDEDLLSHQMEMIRNYIECRIPRTIYNTIANKVIGPYYSVNDWSPMSSYWKYADVSKRPPGGLQNSDTRAGKANIYLFRSEKVKETTKNLSIVPFEECTWGLHGNHMNLPTWKLLIGLTFIELELPDSDRETVLITLLNKLYNLKYLRLRIYTDNIAKCIADNCKLIDTLDFSYSDINDDSVGILTQLSNLKYVELSGTSVTEKGIAKFLLSCTNIEYINAVNDNTNLIEPALEHITIFKENAWRKFKLKFYANEENSTLERLQLVVETCPHIQKIYLIRHSDSPNYLSYLNNLQNLCELELSSFEFDVDSIRELLEARGCDLVHLRLSEFKNMLDLNSLLCICNLCPNLQSLSIDFLWANRTVTHENDEIEIPELIHLKKLTVAWATDKQLVFLLSVCPNVEFINIRRRESATDSFMLQVLDKNPKSFMHLKKLIIRGNLSTLAIDRIVHNCISPPEIVAHFK